MREIKFRGKRVDNGEWVYGALVNWEFWINERWEKHSAILNGSPCNKKPQESDYVEVFYKTVGQYTGLKDKNDVEIYEGDILDEDDYKFYVVWDETYCKFYLKHDNQAYQYPEWNRGVLMEVVGNIHEVSK